MVRLGVEGGLELNQKLRSFSRRAPQSERSMAKRRSEGTAIHAAFSLRSEAK
jgi:hypothetical protein